jgi:hypothetical protein
VETETEAQVSENIIDWRTTGDGEEMNKRIKALEKSDIEGLGYGAPAEVKWRDELKQMAATVTGLTRDALYHLNHGLSLCPSGQP